MSYEIHITRAEEMWSEGGADAIPSDEWVAVADADTDLERYADDGFTYVASSIRRDSRPATFAWSEGNIDVPRPDRATFMKAYELARRLGAHVVDDEGTTYTHADEFG